jgi:DNA polymerase I
MLVKGDTPVTWRQLIENLRADDLLGVSPPLTVHSERGVVVGLYHPSWGRSCVDVDVQDVPAFADAVYSGKQFRVAVHGLKRIRECLGWKDLVLFPERILDTRLMAHLLDPDFSENRGYLLSHLCKRYLHADYPLQLQGLLDLEYPEFLYRSLSQDAEIIYHLAETLGSQLSPNLLRLYREVELPVSDVLVRMHIDGIGVDRARCAKEWEHTQAHLAQLETELQADRRNLYSGRDVYWLLRDHGLPFPDEVVHGFTLDDDDLRVLSSDHDCSLAEAVLLWRSLMRASAFLEVGAEHDRVHPTWHLTRTATGRISASYPPVQSLDKKRFRSLLKAEDGSVLIKADWKTCQARILAHLCQDEALMKLFREGTDFHDATARLLGLANRDEAKPINFGLIFGQGAQALMREINRSWTAQGKAHQIDEQTAEQYINTFFSTYPGIQPFFQRQYDELVSASTRERVLRNPLTGRIRRFDRRASKKMKREMQATLLQQVESHILKLSLIKLAGELKNLGSRSRIVMIIHDAIWVEAPEEDAGRVRELMRYVMTESYPLDVPLDVDFD